MNERRSTTKDAGQQLNPLLPGYSFNLYLVAGLTPIVQGGALDFDGDRSFECETGDVLLFPPGVPHYYGRAPDSAEWYHRWIYFRPRGFWASWLQWPMREGQRVGRLHLGDPQVYAEIDKLFVDVDNTHRGGKRTSEELAINLLERLLIRCHEEMPGFQSRPLDPRVQAACQLITNNLAGELSLEEIARHVCLSPSRFAHLFREQMGVNIVRWREDQRLILAKLMLQSTATPVSTIAARVGYEDQLYFSRVFRKRVGVSPTEYRRSSEEPHDPWGEEAHGTAEAVSQDDAH